MASPQYITPAELYDAWDRRLIEQLSGDGPNEGPIDSGNSKIVTAIERASEDVQLAATVGQRYSTDDLDTLQTDDRWALKGLVADLVVGYLVDRRAAGVNATVQNRIDKAREKLEALRGGQEVFPIAVNRIAGRIDIDVITDSERDLIGLVGNSDFFPNPPSRAY